MSDFTAICAMHSDEATYIEAPYDEAKLIFYHRTGTNPNRVSCTCCGSDYSITEYDSLEDASEGQRTIYDYSRYPAVIQRIDSLETWLARPDILVIRADEIQDDERHGYLPNQGYIWVG